MTGCGSPACRCAVLAGSRGEARTPLDYQRQAHEQMNAALRPDGTPRGVLVLPTGSGKTFTAAHWLAEHALARGVPVLWLAHQSFLLTQARAAFADLAGGPGLRVLVVRDVRAVVRHLGWREQRRELGAGLSDSDRTAGA